MASKMLADGVDGADKMTLLELDGLAEAEKDMDEAQRENLMGAVGSVLKMSSINGDAAAKLGDGKYGVVHGDGLDGEAPGAERTGSSTSFPKRPKQAWRAQVAA